MPLAVTIVILFLLFPDSLFSHACRCLFGVFDLADADRGQTAPSLLVRARLRAVLHAEILERRARARQPFHPPH